MKSNDFPVEVDGNKLLVDRVFSGAPAIYICDGDGGFKHIKGGIGGPVRIREKDLTEHRLVGIEPGQIIVFAHANPEAEAVE